MAVAWLCAAWMQAEPVQPVSPQEVKIPPFAQDSQVLLFAASKPASVVVAGSRAGFLGLYVFDRHGNCVAWDDVSRANRDALGVDWIPSLQDSYGITIANLSRASNKCVVLIR
jgi:hypothetical protein